MNRLHSLSVALTAVTSLVGLAGCRGQTSKDTPIFGIRNMYDQPKYEVQEESSFFPDKRTMRPLVEGVVARDQQIDPTVAQGRLEDQSGYVLEIPDAVVASFGGRDKLVARGQERYGIYCTPCHDATGNGNGLVKQRAVKSGATAFVPPTFHQDRLRHIPDGQVFATISNGKGNMPAYVQVPVMDRWAIVSYVRVLQLASPALATNEAPAAAPAQAAPSASASAQPAAATSDAGASPAVTATDAGAAKPTHPTKTDGGAK